MEWEENLTICCSRHSSYLVTWQIPHVDGKFFLCLATLSVFLVASLVLDAIGVWKYVHSAAT